MVNFVEVCIRKGGVKRSECSIVWLGVLKIDRFILVTTDPEQ